MTALQTAVYIALIAAAIVQLSIAVTGLRLVSILDWQQALGDAPLLLRQVFQVHKWFISLTVAMFAVLTLRFAPEMLVGRNAVAAWVAGGIGLFWAIRAVLQVGYYSSSHWRGQRGRTAIHVGLLLAFGVMAAAYLLAAVGV